MSQMPEIKPVVNKEPERDKKKAGLLARLFGGGAGLGGLGGAGAGGGLGGLAGGGLLATKAGLLAMILVGTTVAGGIGMVGYRLFGPGAAMTGNGDNLQLFASKPKESSADGQAGAKGDGNSASLQYLSQANASPKDADAAAAAAAAAAKDATAAGATGSETAASTGNGPINAMGSSGNGVHKGLLKNAGKFGALSAPGGGGGSGAVANSAPQKSAFAANPGAKGSLSGFKKTAAAKIGAGGARSLAGRHFRGAVGQGFGVLGNQRGAQSSYAAGQTYDGAAQGGSNIGANGTPIGGPGAGAAGGAAQPKSLAGPAVDQNTSQNIPTPPATPMAPWQHAIQAAQAMLGVATLLLLAAQMIGKMKDPWTIWVVRSIGAIVAALGIAVIALGAQIAGGKYGQKLQGGILTAAGVGLTIAGAMVMFSDQVNSKDATQGSPGIQQHPNMSSIGDTPATPGTPAVAQGNSVLGSGGIMDANPFVLIGGGVGLVGLAATMMMPPTKYPASSFNGKPPPDVNLWGYQEMPSQAALNKMVA